MEDLIVCDGLCQFCNRTHCINHPVNYEYGSEYNDPCDDPSLWIPLDSTCFDGVGF